MMPKEPLKITLEYYSKKISTEIDYSDVTLEDIHGMWLEIVRAMGFHNKTIADFYNE